LFLEASHSAKSGIGNFASNRCWLLLIVAPEYQENIKTTRDQIWCGVRASIAAREYRARISAPVDLLSL
jgi:hypothetical protein